MSRKTLRRSHKKRKCILKRKNQKQRKIMARVGKSKNTTSDINYVLSVDYNQQQEGVKETNSEASACNHYDIPEDTIRSWYERIRNKLSGDANKRVYHNWNCMLAPKRIELETAKPYLVLAAFFQYYEFDLDKSCVQENCKIFKQFCEDSMIEDEKMKETVCYLLGENTTEPIDCDIDNDVAFLQDLDLLILASDKDVYKNYAELSRQEWSTYGKTNFDILRRKFETGEKPSTSREGKKQISPMKNNNKNQSPWRNAGGKVNKFKKIIDDQARKLIKRSVHIMKDNKSPRKITPRKKATKRLINRNKVAIRRAKCKRNSNNTNDVISLDESEIRTDDETLCLKTPAINKSNANYDNRDDEDDDDCVLIEPHVAEITIEDDNENESDDSPSCSDASSNYQSLVRSLKERVSSTPSDSSKCNLQKIPVIGGERSNETLPFFIDVFGRRSGIETINSTDSFSEYTKLNIGLGDKAVSKKRKARLNESNCNVVIDLDMSESKEQSSTLKRKSPCNDNHDDDDDSIIFISETNKNDFIPINDCHLVPPRKIYKINETPSTPVNRPRLNSSLFTLSETKKINEYNKNAYNPSENKQLTSGKRMVILDGSNVAFKHGLDQAFSVKGLKIAIDYFEKMGHEVKAVIPQFRMNKSKSTDHEELERLHKAGKIVQTPCKNLPGLTSSSYDDRFILQLAFELDAAIVSNDNYRDLLHENPAFKKIIENRVIGYTWCNDIFILPKDPYGKWGPTLHKILNR